MTRRKLVLPWPFALIPPLFTTNRSRETSGIGDSILVRKRRRSKKESLSYGIGRPGVILAEASYRAPGHRSVLVPGIYTFPSAGAMDFLESAQERGKPERSNDRQGGQQRDDVQILDPGQSRASRIKKRCVVTLEAVWGRDVIGPRPFLGPLLQTA
ncbi:hypothetical protein MKX08_010492 [Trichoderma sp. CBMAI-0020]|nr:hypothetical protein MKX08_010492 [Trichoderma sp. CBMAI-0020]